MTDTRHMRVDDWPAYHYRAVMTRVVDGDTIEVLLDLGDRTFRKRRVRILGFDAPELFSGDDYVAGGLSRNALKNILPIGSLVYIETKLDRTSFDRLLGVVYVEGSDGDLYMISEAMIAGGFGTAS